MKSSYFALMVLALKVYNLEKEISKHIIQKSRQNMPNDLEEFPSKVH